MCGVVGVVLPNRGHEAAGVAAGSVEDRGGRVADALEVPLRDLGHAWEHGLGRALGWEG